MAEKELEGERIEETKQALEAAAGEDSWNTMFEAFSRGLLRL